VRRTLDNLIMVLVAVAMATLEIRLQKHDGVDENDVANDDVRHGDGVKMNMRLNDGCLWSVP
jgi:hypothetical protein